MMNDNMVLYRNAIAENTSKKKLQHQQPPLPTHTQQKKEAGKAKNLNMTERVLSFDFTDINRNHTCLYDKHLIILFIHIVDI